MRKGSGIYAPQETHPVAPTRGLPTWKLKFQPDATNSEANSTWRLHSTQFSRHFARLWPPLIWASWNRTYQLVVGIWCWCWCWCAMLMLMRHVDVPCWCANFMLMRHVDVDVKFMLMRHVDVDAPISCWCAMLTWHPNTHVDVDAPCWCTMLMRQFHVDAPCWCALKKRNLMLMRHSHVDAPT